MNTGKVVLITGANGGLGTSVTRAFLDAGATVVGAATKIQDADFPHLNFSAISVDLLKGAEGMVKTAIERHGRIDGLVHLAGGFAGGKSVAETDDAVFDHMLDLNLRAAFFSIRAVLPQMRTQGSGRIVAIGSKSAFEPSPMAGAYAASKAALVSLVQTIARENGDHGITANVVSPGTMDTPGNRASMPSADFAKWVQPKQVAALLIHLVLGDASQLNGAAIPIYGNGD